MAATCLVLGLLLGYLFRDSGAHGSPQAPSPVQAASVRPATMGASSNAKTGMPTLEQMHQMADKQAEPLLAKLKDDPGNADLLNQVANIYRATHQFKEAGEYYQKALKIAPKNVAVRTDLASCLFYEGDMDGALAQLQQSLQYAPGDANSLFNLGMIRWQGKKDANGAAAAWQQLLKLNPKLPAGKRAEVQKLIDQVKLQSAASRQSAIED